ncbi:hypothetical protein HFP15_25710 [Amycolatopsis sp. K13G38]|uniref:Uncharacterized protein n=1 Tax=Amycolatopsis acididurans TaxID=2724524 RepID=A0ABX1J908_9PSEU|nr:SAM-dependent methyltransferase [Amycolatopsis acididurans]NKQ56280.1 hypothetical protein [Amycolatopsis acididurans]
MLPFVPGFDEARTVVGGYRARLAPGSHLALTHLTPARGATTLARQEEVNKVYNRNVAEQVASRSPEEIAEFFTGMELVPPGLVPVPGWRPDEPGYVPDEEDEARKVGLAGIARKP